MLRRCSGVKPVYSSAAAAFLPTDTESTSMPRSFKSCPILSLAQATPKLPVLVPGCAILLSAATAGQQVRCCQVALEADLMTQFFCSNSISTSIATHKKRLVVGQEHASDFATAADSVGCDIRDATYTLSMHLTLYRTHVVLNLRISYYAGVFACRA